MSELMSWQLLVEWCKSLLIFRSIHMLSYFVLFAYVPCLRKSFTDGPVSPIIHDEKDWAHL
jgi:hypothetical protein